MNVINVAIVGAGYMAEEYLKVLSDINEFNIVGISSRNINRCFNLKKKFKRLKVFENIDIMYNETKSDLVIVTCSAESTRMVAETVTRYPWIILFEKPIGLGIREYEEIIEICKNRFSKAYVALNRRYYSSTERMTEMLKNIDGPRYVEINDQEVINSNLKESKHPKVIENWMFGNSIHLIDYIDILCRGSLSKIQIMNQWDSNNPKLVSARLNFDSGDVVNYTAIWNAPAPWSIRVYTKDKYLISQPIETLSYIDKASRQIIKVKLDSIDEKYKPGLFRLLQEIVRYHNGKENKLVSVFENKNTMQYISKIYEQ